MQRTTIRDVAKRAGVSHTTVSMAIHGSGEISEQRRQEILRVAKEMNYEPRAAAQLLRAKRSGQIGAIVAARHSLEAFEQDFSSPILAHWVQDCADRGLRYMIELCHHDSPGRWPHQVRSGLVDGSIVIGDVGDAVRRWLDEQAGYPWVSIGEPAGWAVLIDGEAATDEVMQHLAELGHRHVAYAGGPMQYVVHRTAYAGFQRAVRDRGLTIARSDAGIHLFDEPPRSPELAVSSMQWMRQLLAGPDRPTALFCHGVTLARTAVTAALELGLRVPRDLSLVTWGSPWAARQTCPCLTTLAVNYEQMTRLAMELIRSRIDGKPVKERVRWVRPRLVEGETVGAVPAEIKVGVPI